MNNLSNSLEALPSLHTLQSMKINDIVTYLEANDWEMKDDARNLMKWVHEGEKRKVILLPTNKSFDDFNEVMFRALQGIAYVEDKKLNEVVTDIMQIVDDVLRVRVSGMYTQDGTIPIEQGVELIQRTKEMLIAVSNATAAKEPKPIYYGVRSDDTNDFIKNVKLGQTEVGSYIITAHSPLPNIQTQIENVADEYFPRRVYQKTAEALGAALKAKKQAVETSNIEVFKTYIDKGLSANFCDALAELRGENDQATIDFNFTWSPYFVKPEIKSEYVFTPEDIPVMRDAANFFRKIDPVESFILRGFVVGLNHDRRDTPGTITIESSNKDFRGKKVKVTLDADDYNKAIHAHEHWLIVQCTGRLVKEGKYYELREMGDFKYEELIQGQA